MFDGGMQMCGKVSTEAQIEPKQPGTNKNAPSSDMGTVKSQKQAMYCNESFILPR